MKPKCARVEWCFLNLLMRMNPMFVLGRQSSTLVLTLDKELSSKQSSASCLDTAFPELTYHLSFERVSILF